MNGIVKMVTGDNSAKKAASAAMEAQAAAQKQQEAVQARMQIREDNRAKDLSAQDAVQRRAIQARRKGSASLAFTGPVAALKNTLGG